MHFDKSKTSDCQKPDSSRAKIRMIIKQCMKKYKYSPEGMNNDI